MLPGADGLSLARRIRAHKAGADTVILVVTGKRDPNVLQESLDAGADDYLAKPVDVALFSLRLAVAEREVISKRQRRRDQARVAAQAAEISSLVSNLDEVLFAIDARSGRLLAVSPATQRLLGRAPETLMADASLWRSLLFPPEVESRQGELVQGREHSIVHRWRIRLPNETTRWVEVALKGARDPAGALVRIDGVLSDVTEAQRSQDELAARNKELMTLYRISEITLTAPTTERAYHEILEELCKATAFPIAVIERYDPDRERLYVTSSWGIPPGRIPSEMSAHDTLAGAAIRTGQPVTEFNARSRRETANDVLQSLGVSTYLAFPMLVNQQVVGALVLAHTEEMEPDRRLVRWAGSLANGVAQFLDRVDGQEALRESEQRHRRLAEELQQANHELERFAYSVAHDLRAPLRTMQGFAHALIQNFAERMPGEARDYAQRIIASGQQAEILIRDLLAYSRLSFEDVELQPVTLTKVIDAAREQLDGDLRETSTDLQVEGELPQVLGQQIILVQTVANLISNAIKFVPVGRKPRIRIRAESHDGWVRLRVIDNGIGIPAGQEERIFRIFERLSEGGAHPGTGIGLAIVRRGMERIGGRAGVERNQGAEGSSFWIDIPRLDSPQSRALRRRKS